MPTLDQAALREVQALILDLKDEIIGRLLNNEKLTTEEIYRVQAMIAKLDATGVAGQLHKVLTKYGSWAYKNGVEKIDAFLTGEGLAGTLALPQSSIDLAAGYIGDQIKTIPANLLADVSKQITLGYLGQRTPQEIMRRVSDRFNVSLARAETIVRTETKKLQNFGSEARIREAADGGKKLGLKSLRYWIHSSGSPLPGDGEEANAKGKYRVAYDPRPHHKAMHGTAVEVDAKFHLVNRETRESWLIDGPHDPALPAGEVVNCYCDRVLRIDRESVELLPQLKKKGADPAAHEPIAPRPGQPPETDPIPAQRTPQAAAMAAAGFATGGVITRDPFTGASLVRDPAAVPEPPAPRAPHSPKPVARRASAPQAPAVPVVPDSPAALSTPWGKPLDEAKLRGIDLHTAEASWSVPKGSWWSKRSYGAVMIDDNGRILMREPKGNFGGYAWTFPKGGLSHAKEHPLDAALREVGEETGYGGQVMGLVPGTFKGDTTRTNFFLMRPGAHNPATMDGETSALRWVSRAEAKALIMQSKNKKGRTRDLAILEAALEEHELIKSGQQTYAHLFGEEAAPVQPVAPVTRVPSSGFPASTEGLMVVRRLGGSTGAQLVEDPATGKRFVMKRGAHPDHLLEEAAADTAYQALGVKVPAFKLYRDDSGAPVKLAEYIPEARTLAQIMKTGKQAERDAVLTKLREDFTADALLGNWDVVGLEFDNILIDKAGTPWRIDNGGALRFRAQGARKASEQFGATVTELESMRDPTKNAAAARIFGGITEDQIKKQIPALVQRRDAILAAAPGEIRDILARRIDYLASLQSPISETFAEAVRSSNIVGKVLKIDRQDVEDLQVLYWTEKNAKGVQVTKFKTKLTIGGSDNVIDTLRPSLPSQTSWSDPYWDPILSAAKSVNHHVSDGQYSPSKTQALADMKVKLTTLKAKTENQKAMKAQYLQAIEDIEKAMATKSSLAPVSKFAPQPETGAGAGELQVARTTLSYKMKSMDNGRATEHDSDIWANEECYQITIDGVRYRFVPYLDANGQTFKARYAYRGYLEGEMDGLPTAEIISKMNKNLEKLGLKPDVASEAYQEILYLRKGMQIRTDSFDAADLKRADLIISNAAIDDAARISQLKSMVRERMNIDLPATPTDAYDWRMKANSSGNGWERTYRWDLPRSQVEKELKAYTLHHSTGGNLAQVLDSILSGGGDFTPTTERLRKGIQVTSGMSPVEDMNTGGANYLFTRLQTKTQAYKRRGFTFKVGNIARQDAFTFDHDRFGRVNDSNSYSARKKTVAEMKAASKSSNNETILKWGLNTIDELDMLVASSAHERQELINVLKQHGFDRLPDGRSAEEAVCVVN